MKIQLVVSIMVQNETARGIGGTNELLLLNNELLNLLLGTLDPIEDK